MEAQEIVLQLPNLPVKLPMTASTQARVHYRETVSSFKTILELNNTG